MSNDTVIRKLEAFGRIVTMRRFKPEAHWRKLMAAWRQIAAHKYIPGTMQWAEKHHTDRYHRVTSELLAELERLWDGAAPLDQFQAALDRWVAPHEELIGLFPVSRGTE